MATRTSVGSGNWSDAGTWDTKPAAGDDVIIADGHVVAINENTSIATLTAAGNTGYCTCDADVTMTLTGGGITYAGTLTLGFIRLTGHTLTILGSGATCLITASAAGYALVVSNDATYILNNGTAAALLNSSSGRCISSTSTSTTCSVTGNCETNGSGYCITSSVGTVVVVGTATATASGAALYVYGNGGVLTLVGKLVGARANMYAGTVLVGSGSATAVFNWTGTYTYTSEYLCIRQASGTVNLGTGVSPNNLALTNTGSVILINSVSGTVVTDNFSHVRTTTASQLAFNYTSPFVDTGPSLPAAGDVDSTASQYGYAADLQTPTCLIPASGDVKLGIPYGSGSTEFVGTYAGVNEYYVSF